MNDDELHRQVERLAQHFESQGFVVTRQLEVEAALVLDQAFRVRELIRWDLFALNALVTPAPKPCEIATVTLLDGSIQRGM